MPAPKLHRLLQKGHTPLTRMLAPVAMGEAHQVGSDKDAEGQAGSRRVAVRVIAEQGYRGNLVLYL